MRKFGHHCALGNTQGPYTLYLQYILMQREPKIEHRSFKISVRYVTKIFSLDYKWLISVFFPDPGVHGTLWRVAPQATAALGRWPLPTILDPLPLNPVTVPWRACLVVVQRPSSHVWTTWGCRWDGRWSWSAIRPSVTVLVRIAVWPLFLGLMKTWRNAVRKLSPRNANDTWKPSIYPRDCCIGGAND